MLKLPESSQNVIESRILESVKANLLYAKVIGEIEQRIRREGSGEKPKDNSAQIASLQKQIENLTDAIANGLLASSPALASRLSAAEAELAHLTNEQKVVAVRRPAQDIAEAGKELERRPRASTRRFG